MAYLAPVILFFTGKQYKSSKFMFLNQDNELYLRQIAKKNMVLYFEGYDECKEAIIYLHHYQGKIQTVLLTVPPTENINLWVYWRNGTFEVRLYYYR